MKNILIIGDALLDLFHYGSADRVSPEAPCLVFNKQSMNFACGGAANVALQLKHFPCKTKLFGLADAECLDKIKDNGFDVNDVVLLEEGHNPRKIRIVADGTNLIRLDNEKENYGVPDLTKYRERILSKILPQIKDASAIVLSDYCKGVFDKNLAQQIIQEANKHNVIVVADVKKNLDWWKVDYIKPNWKESQQLTQKTNINEISQSLLNHCKNYIITKSGDGVFYGNKDFQEFYETKNRSERIANVSGSGDCFTAVLVYYLAAGDNIHEACRKAFTAGQVYISHLHNRPVAPFEINRKLKGSEAKIISVEELIYLKNNVYKNEKFTLTNGVIDCLHWGHISTIKFAKSHGDKCVVAINSDQSVKRLKGESRPIIPFEQRVKCVASLECVDFVVGFDTEEELEKLSDICDNVVKGEEYKNKNAVGKDKMIFAPTQLGISTTNIIQQIQGKIDK